MLGVANKGSVGGTSAGTQKACTFRQVLPVYSNSSFNAMPLWERHCWHMRAYLWQRKDNTPSNVGMTVLVFQHRTASLCECCTELVVVFLPSHQAVFARVVYLFCGPSPTRYSTTLSTRPRSLGGRGLARGGPGGCIPGKTQHTLS